MAPRPEPSPSFVTWRTESMAPQLLQYAGPAGGALTAVAGAPDWDAGLGEAGGLRTTFWAGAGAAEAATGAAGAGGVAVDGAVAGTASVAGCGSVLPGSSPRKWAVPTPAKRMTATAAIQSKGCRGGREVLSMRVSVVDLRTL
ncbi:protein of unknown function [Denitratisoma oestradiolicum]|uniref:Uncharacterized protein n=1 Tax=Denitratisoma oestradiolicum TaxID=311182 RepID=A0A6S6XPA8_9PROT|nr:protein of unknown function [Denitratisoma oestradiolicum]